MRLSTAIGAAALLVGCSAKIETRESGHAPERAVSRLVGVAETGRATFAERGCVMCHSVNGVGGKAATPLDAEIGGPEIDPLDFAARIFAGAPAMIELQSLELGYAIALSGQDIADLAAFAASIDQQKLLTPDQIPEGMRDSLLDERFWETEEWEEFLSRGQEGSGDPQPE